MEFKSSDGTIILIETVEIKCYLKHRIFMVNVERKKVDYTIPEKDWSDFLFMYQQFQNSVAAQKPKLIRKPRK